MTVLTPPAGGSPSPDIPNWAWHEYGNRVGFWRLLKVFDDFKQPAALAINGSAIAAYPAIVEAAIERKWEFMGHGFTQRNMQKAENEREDIRKTTEATLRATGKRPRGSLGPGLTETWETPDILVEEGYEYVCDWVLDDQPGVAQDAHQADRQRALYAGVQRRGHDAHPASQGVGVLRPGHRPVRAEIYADAEGSARIMAIVIHPYIMGAPHRTKYFRRILEAIHVRPDVAFLTGEQILDWYLSVGPKAP